MAKFAKLLLKKTNENLGTDEGEGTPPDNPGIVSGTAAADGAASAVADAAAGGVGVVPTAEPAVGGEGGQPGAATNATSTATPPVVGSEANPAAAVATAAPVPPAQGGEPAAPAPAEAAGLTEANPAAAPVVEPAPVAEPAPAVEPVVEPVAEPAPLEPTAPTEPVAEIPTGEPAAPAAEPEPIPGGQAPEPAAALPVDPPAAEPVVEEPPAPAATEPTEVIGTTNIEGGTDTPLETGTDEEIAAAADEEVGEIEAEAADESAATEMTELNQGMDTAFDAVDRIEELRDVAADAIENDGGLTETEAGVIEATHESLMKSLGMSHRETKFSVSPVVTMEHYSSPRTKLSASMVTMEKLSDSVSQLKTHISDGFKKFIEMLKASIKRYVEETFTLRGQAQKLLSSVNAMPADAKPAQAQLSGSAVAVTVKGTANVNSALALVAASEKMVAIGAKGAADIAQRMKTSTNIGEAMMDGDTMREMGELEGLPTANGGVLTLGGGTGSSIDEAPAQSAQAPTREQVVGLLNAIVKAVDSSKAHAENLTRALDSMTATDQSPAAKAARAPLTRLGNVASVTARRNLVAALGFAKHGASNLKAAA